MHPKSGCFFIPEETKKQNKSWRQKGQRSKGCVLWSIKFEEPKYNSETEAAIQEARDIADGKIQTKSYNSAAELFEELDNE